MDFSTDDWSFSLEDDKPVAANKNHVSVPFIATPEAWNQYNNEVIYRADKLMRDWLTTMQKNKKWCKSQNMRKYTYKDLFQQIYGRPYDPKEDARYTNPHSKVFAYYSTRIMARGTELNGKLVTKPVYVIGSKRIEKPPYSLKLRLEWMSEQGIIPNVRNMALPKDLKKGTARNPLTNENMRRRKELGRQRYKGRYDKSGKAGTDNS